MRRRRIPSAIMYVVTIPPGAVMTGCGLHGGTDRTDYSAIDEGFLLRNALIARKIGKVEKLDHFGDGGGTDDISYKVYRLAGTEGTATCTLSLHRDEKGWEVTTAAMSIATARIASPPGKPNRADFACAATIKGLYSGWFLHRLNGGMRGRRVRRKES